MSEHDDRYVRSDLPRTTGEFRAAPDASASTAEFKAFVANQDQGDAQRGGVWPEQPSAGGATRSGSNRTIALVVAAVVVIAIIAIIVAVG
jgi:hypothetical protein